MANICLILGKSGTGKSSSIKGLNPKETVVLNVLGKKLPFKGSMKLYNDTTKNLFRVDNYTQVVSMLEAIGTGGGSLLTAIAVAIAVMGLITAGNVAAIRRRIATLWRQTD